MSICFFTPNAHSCKVPRNFSNMRTEFAWQCALDADHENISNPTNKTYNTGLLILPKKFLSIADDIQAIKKRCDRLLIIQEGPNDYWQDYSIDQQEEFLQALADCDGILCHNIKDINYYSQYTKAPVTNISPLIIEDSIRDKDRFINRSQPKLNRVVIGGGFCSWYSGRDSYRIAQNLSPNIACAGMGRKNTGEIELYTGMDPEIQNLGWQNHSKWMGVLSRFRYGVHLMRTFAAGTFALNCAYYGIPCIGYKYLDSQRECHPSLSVDLCDLVTAKQIALDLNGPEQYLNASKESRSNYLELFTEEIWLKSDGVKLITG